MKTLPPFSSTMIAMLLLSFMWFGGCQKNSNTGTTPPMSQGVRSTSGENFAQLLQKLNTDAEVEKVMDQIHSQSISTLFKDGSVRSLSVLETDYQGLSREQQEKLSEEAIQTIGGLKKIVQHSLSKIKERKKTDQHKKVIEDMRKEFSNQDTLAI